MTGYVDDLPRTRLTKAEWRSIADSCAWIEMGGYEKTPWGVRACVERVVAARVTLTRAAIEAVFSRHHPENNHAWCSCGWKRPGVGSPRLQHAAHVTAEIDAAIAQVDEGQEADARPANDTANTHAAEALIPDQEHPASEVLDSLASRLFMADHQRPSQSPWWVLTPQQQHRYLDMAQAVLDAGSWLPSPQYPRRVDANETHAQVKGTDHEP